MVYQWKKDIIGRKGEMEKMFDRVIVAVSLILVCLKAIKNIWSSL